MLRNTAKSDYVQLSTDIIQEVENYIERLHIHFIVITVIVLLVSLIIHTIYNYVVLRIRNKKEKTKQSPYVNYVETEKSLPVYYTLQDIPLNMQTIKIRQRLQENKDTHEIKISILPNIN